MNPARARGGVIALCALALLLAACGRGAPSAPSIPDRPSGTVLQSDAPPTQSPESETGSPTPAEGDAQGQGDGGGDDAEGDGKDKEGTASGASPDDLQVFAYASTDEATMAAELADLVATTDVLLSDIQAFDVAAAKDDAETAIHQAEKLEKDAGNAEQRQRPLGPDDPTLVKARGDAIDAFGLTADYAATVVDACDAVLDGDLAALQSTAASLTGLSGASDDLAQSYTDLTAELEAWATENPAAAAEALATYA